MLEILDGGAVHRCDNQFVSEFGFSRGGRSRSAIRIFHKCDAATDLPRAIYYS
jgi:hypothetical protein